MFHLQFASYMAVDVKSQAPVAPSTSTATDSNQTFKPSRYLWVFLHGWNRFWSCQRLLLTVTHPHISHFLHFLLEYLQEWHLWVNLMSLTEASAVTNSSFSCFCRNCDDDKPQEEPPVYIKKPLTAFNLFLKDQMPIAKRKGRGILSFMGTMVSLHQPTSSDSQTDDIRTKVWVWALLSCVHSGSLCQNTKKRNIIRRQKSRSSSTSSRTQAGPLKTTM